MKKHKWFHKADVMKEYKWFHKEYKWFIKYKWFHVGRWHFMLLPPRVTATTDGGKIMDGDKWEIFISILVSNPWYLLGLKRYGKYT